MSVVFHGEREPDKTKAHNFNFLNEEELVNFHFTAVGFPILRRYYLVNLPSQKDTSNETKLRRQFNSDILLLLDRRQMYTFDGKSKVPHERYLQRVLQLSVAFESIAAQV